MQFLKFLVFVFIFSSNFIVAQGIWKLKSNAYVEKKLKDCKVDSRIKKFTSWQLKYSKLKSIAYKAKPKKDKVDNIVIELPSIDGSIKHFKLYLSETMSEELAKQFPEIKSLVGVCVEDKSVTARLDLNESGLHVLISNNTGAQFLIEPYCPKNTIYYTTYLKSDFESKRDRFDESKE